MLKIEQYIDEDCGPMYLVRDAFTGVIIIDACETMQEAKAERDAYLDEMHSFNAGPYSN